MTAAVGRAAGSRVAPSAAAPGGHAPGAARGGPVRGVAAVVARVAGGRIAWVLLAAVVAAVLAIGSIHSPTPTAAARISHLDSVIKCPSCDDLSIAQSDASTAVALRAVVAADVHVGMSDAQIEAYAESKYGSSILLDPSDPVVWALPLAAIGVALVALGAVLWRRRRRDGGEGADVDAGAGDGAQPLEGGAAGARAAAGAGARDEELVAAALARRSDAEAEADADDS